MVPHTFGRVRRQCVMMAYDVTGLRHAVDSDNVRIFFTIDMVRDSTELAN